MKHVFVIVRAPPAMHVLQIAGAVNEQYRGPAAFVIRWQVDAAIDSCAVARFETDDRRIDPVVREEFRNRRSRHRLISDHGLTGRKRLIDEQIQLRRPVAVRAHISKHRFIRRDIYLVTARKAGAPRALAAADRHGIEMSLEWTAFAGSEIKLCLVSREPDV